MTPAVRSRVLAVVERCSPYVKLQHFDAGVRHWLVRAALRPAPSTQCGDPPSACLPTLPP